VRYEWDEDKNKRNIEKHGIDFADAEEIWNDPPTERSRRTVEAEERITALGRFRDREIVIVYTERGENVRIISIRPANRKERAGTHREDAGR
jgi:uncharacterized protein